MKVKKVRWLMLGAIFFAGAAGVYAYPPDNAAVLYYNTMTHYEGKDARARLMADFAKGGRDPNDMIRGYVNGNMDVINTVLDACEIKNCDWGLDYSKGLELTLPHLYPMKRFAELLLADSRLLAADGNYQEALSRCMSSYKLARHLNERAVICYLGAMRINNQTNDCVVWILGQMFQDTQSLTQLKNQLAAINGIPFPIKPAILEDRETMLLTISPEKPIEDIYRIIEAGMLGPKSESFKKKVRSFDKAMIDRGREYYEDSMSVVPDAFDMPYTQGYTVLISRSQKVTEDAKSKPEAIVAEALLMDYHKILSIMVHSQTYNNALKAAIEVYLIKARMGKLPESLPESLPGDLFSGKPFVYEKTANGFALRCQGKNLSKDEIDSYEFKVK